MPVQSLPPNLPDSLVVAVDVSVVVLAGGPVTESTLVVLEVNAKEKLLVIPVSVVSPFAYSNDQMSLQFSDPLASVVAYASVPVIAWVSRSEKLSYEVVTVRRQ